MEGHTINPLEGSLAGEVRGAEETLWGAVQEDEGKQWSPRELQAIATKTWSSSVVSIAFWRLVSDGRLSVDEKFRVHRIAEHPA